MSRKKDFSDYGDSFQKKLAEIILRDRPFADKMEEVLDLDLFDLQYLRVFVNEIFSYRQEYGTHPSVEITKTIIRDKVSNLDNDSLALKLREYTAKISDDETDSVADSEFVKQEAFNFCKSQRMKGALIQSLDLIEDKNYEDVVPMLQEAVSMGEDKDTGHDYQQDFEARYNEKNRNPVSTGWPQFDKIMKGGHGMGELGVCIAPTGAGKSFCLVHLGNAGLQQEKTVVHYTLELQDTVIGRRYDACVSGISLNDLNDRKDDVLDTVKDVPGKLIIKEYPTKKATVNTIRRHIEKLERQGEDIGLVIIDYADLLSPSRDHGTKRHDLEGIYENLRGLSSEFKFPVWTASQTNRDGLEKEVVTMEQISEAYNKCFVADFIFTLSRNIKDKNSNGGRMLVAKNRNGADGMVFPIYMDPAYADIRVEKPLDAGKDELEQERRKKERESVKNILQDVAE